MLREITFGLCLTFGTTLAMAASLSDGKQYDVMAKSVSDAPAVVEFFSFYCPPCAAFSEPYKVSQTIDANLPEGYHVEKYHVSAMGSMGKPLTEAWSVAKVLGIQSRVEQPLFTAVQKTKSINSEDAIRQIFIQAGVSSEEYDAVKNSFAVKALTEKQERAATQFAVTGTPSFYVRGKYLIRNNGIEERSPEAYGKAFADVVNALLKEK
ncbi:protein disulfide oxidoreductase DsbA [Pectobacterium parmentieri]|uniref:Thiol:disulfide interchange protein n=1 Tax=Pectobacterium parmentieri TaxID=1905730 RepID=A0A0H3I4R1_PECPM|nr:DsbA family protein [Pectobacterium parmentieri]AFI89683.1 Thiol:disulfide interchange protein DsbA [Pectobacterium parmentieri]MBI0472102.1 thioredoxin domain-containing protein [Pectobacterium parmentieri]MBI0495865.1 thioredoxin domain-containing protein [Pectobacterium parmentieri]MBI0556263.1 thioredoxin domain-containing protein [Pectobacterium parmentieri]MBI0569347.1 thioredoxin domain-containing protein [Pectobacterium parmentieri]